MTETETVHAIVQFKRMTQAEWANSEYVPRLSELVFESDTGYAKFGDGVHRFSELKYMTGPKGEQGIQGIQGPPGRDGVVTFETLTKEQRDSLKGEKGERGEPGIQGIQGVQGEQGIKGDVGERGHSVFVKYSEYSDGHDMTDNVTENSTFIGICTSLVAPTEYTAYQWIKIRDDNLDVSVENNVLKIKRGSKVNEVALPNNNNVIAYQLANQLANPESKKSFALALNTKKGLGAALIVLKGDDPGSPLAENRPLLNVETFADLNALSGDLLSWILPISGYQTWETMLISNFEILDLYLKNVAVVPDNVKEYLNNAMNQNSVLYQFIAGHPQCSKLMSETPINFEVINHLKEYITIMASESTLSQLFSNPNNVNYIFANAALTQVILANATAVQAMLANATAVQIIFANATAVQAILANATAVQAMITHNDLLQKNAKTLYNTISTSPKWVNNGLKKSDYAVSFSYPAKTIIFTNAGGYISRGVSRILHPNNTIAGDGAISNLANATKLDTNNLIVTFPNGKTQAVSGDDYYMYEAWTLNG